MRGRSDNLPAVFGHYVTMRRQQANYTIRTYDEKSIWLEDDSNAKGGRSVTNAAEEVIANLIGTGLLRAGMRVYYTDTMGCIDELKHDGVRFTGFAPGPFNGDAP